MSGATAPSSHPHPARHFDAIKQIVKLQFKLIDLHLLPIFISVPKFLLRVPVVLNVSLYFFSPVPYRDINFS